MNRTAGFVNLKRYKSSRSIKRFSKEVEDRGKKGGKRSKDWEMNQKKR